VIPLNRHLILEMACIFLVASALGIVWNYRLLSSVWSGGAVETPMGPKLKTGQKSTPLPLGLIQVKELYDRHEALLVDARNGTAFAAGHITGAYSLPVGEAEAQSGRFREQVPLSSPIVAYCNGYDCHDSMELGEKLLGWGYGTVYVFEGGYPEWREAGYPTEGDTR
jgi:rhodanese-related sulfurtransferase